MTVTRLGSAELFVHGVDAPGQNVVSEVHDSDHTPHAPRREELCAKGFVSSAV
jgi:hypothetical protein